MRLDSRRGANRRGRVATADRKNAVNIPIEYCANFRRLVRSIGEELTRNRCVRRLNQGSAISSAEGRDTFRIALSPVGLK